MHGPCWLMRRLEELQSQTVWESSQHALSVPVEESDETAGVEFMLTEYLSNIL